MSWSVNIAGKPDAVVKALEEHSGKLSGQSKVEYDDALPFLTGLVKQNFVAEGAGYNQGLMQVDASGSGAVTAGEQKQRSCSVKITPLYINLVQ